MVTVVSVAVFALAMVLMWAWVGYARRNSHVKSRRR
jgi:hypothetical protein